ncbi:Dehydrogenase/reductase SDR family member 7B [Penicillium brevicompactum]|uniref:Dehydrogenase/reductase SDR family member 7B n=1 Tax=Penicillium brevicompactum TaxID=5074 RepID=A0A9W9R1K7_PENBR|nr:Dehydrogenase/reductase SDR family member 7B [Penicillium brevicompactum]
MSGNLSEDRPHTYPLIDSSKFSGSLKGQVALVTGAGRGIGRAIALAFAHAGANVVCLARTTHEIREVVDLIALETTTEALGISADISRDDDIQDAIQRIKKRFCRVDIIVNNAGIDRIGAFEHETDFKAWWHVLEVNLRGPMALIYQVLPDMLCRNHGVIISIGSRNACFQNGIIEGSPMFGH